MSTTKKTLFLWTLAALLCLGGRATKVEAQTTQGLKDVYGNQFLIGAALNEGQVAGKDPAAMRLVRKHFNSIVAENCTKSEVIHPEENVWNFAPTDSLVAYGERHGMKVIGHCLIWHSQLAHWFAVDGEGNPVSAKVLKKRIKEHITTLVRRYKGRIHGWDVVNEAIIEDGSYRDTPFYRILGEEFIPYAFECAHKADPHVELYYNDYGMNVPGRRDAVVRLIRSLKQRGLRIDAVGMQAHMGMDYPDFDEFETALNAFAAEGVNVMITEWDMSALPTVSQSANIADKAEYQAALNPYPEALPDSVSQAWNARMMRFFQLFLKHADVISRVNAWGVTDGDSWKNDFPVRGRKEYPLLFDRQYQPKPFIQELLSNPTK
jgi:endo-1,4-beta-xylanase